jgi:hypothetical protein
MTTPGREASPVGSGDLEKATLLPGKHRGFAIYYQNELNQAKVEKPVRIALEQLSHIILPSDLHHYLGHEKMSFGGASSCVKYNKCAGASLVKYLYLADEIRKLVSHWNKHALMR